AHRGRPGRAGRASPGLRPAGPRRGDADRTRGDAAADRGPPRHPHRTHGLSARRDAAPGPLAPGSVLVSPATATLSSVRDLVAQVPDPEIPVVTIEDLGILRDVRLAADGTVEVDITPTYSGCPAMEAIQAEIEQRLTAAGHEKVRVRHVLAPAWTTDWISAEGRRKLAEHGIAPPP